MPNNNSSIDSKSITQYKKEEDRVTAEFLKILHYGGHSLVSYLFGEEFDLPSNDIIVESQVYGGCSRPDGCISCDCNYTIMVESKIYTNSINIDQLAGHQTYIANNSSTFLLYITPDETIPVKLENLYHVYWTNWRSIVEQLDNYVKDTQDRLIEYLVNEFRKTVTIVVYKERRVVEADNGTTMIQTEDKEERVIIVGGRWGEDVALRYNAYACQPDRYFHPARYITFCFDHRIKYLFKIIGEPIERTQISGLFPDSYFKAKEPHYNGDERKFFRLELVKEFNPEIKNDATDKYGKPCAYVQRQRYTTYDKIISARVTSEL